MAHSRFEKLKLNMRRPKAIGGAALLTLLLAQTGYSFRHEIADLFKTHQTELAPDALATYPDGSPIPSHIRSAQIIADIERHFPQLKRQVEANLREMDAQGIPHAERELLLAPFDWVENNRNNGHRNIEQLRHDGVNTISLEPTQFLYGLYPVETARQSSAIASYNPNNDTIELPSSFNAQELLDLIVFYHELWHKWRRVTRESIQGREAYEREQTEVANILPPLPAGLRRYLDLDEEAQAHYMEAEFLNVLMKGRLQQRRGNIPLAEVAQFLGAEHRLRRDTLRATLIAARGLYDSTEPLPYNHPHGAYPTSYLQTLVSLYLDHGILPYHIDTNGNVQIINGRR